MQSLKNLFCSFFSEQNKIISSHNIPRMYHKFVGNQCLGFGNSPIETPYKKVQKGCERFEEVVKKFNSTERKDELVKELVALLKWDEK